MSTVPSHTGLYSIYCTILFCSAYFILFPSSAHSILFHSVLDFTKTQVRMVAWHIPLAVYGITLLVLA